VSNELKRNEGSTARYLRRARSAGCARGILNGDGYSDALWRNNSSGAWGWSDIKNNSWHDLGGSSTAYIVAAVGDYNRDSSADVLWRNNNTDAWGWSDVHNNQWHDLGGSSTAYKIV
jgi:hypothetical protein